MIRAWVLPFLLAALPAIAQTPVQMAGQTLAPATHEDPPAARPLPDIPTLMRLVEQHQRTNEAILKDYTFRSATRFDKTDSHGNPKKTETTDSDIFWLHGVQVRRLLRKDGKELSADEQKKETERIDKEVARAQEKRNKADEQGKETDSRGNQEITVSRLLELGAFVHPRREQINGRDTIIVDYTGDPKARTHSLAESAVHDMEGTIWVDEQDAAVQRLEGRFVRDFRIGAGLVASVSKGTSFKASMTRINDEIWLPVDFEAHGHARYLLFFNLEGNLQAHQSNYRKFKATSTILPGLTQVDEEPQKP